VQQYDDLHGSSSFRPTKFCRQKRSSGRWEKLDEARGRRRRKKRGIHDFRSLKRSPCARECLKEIFKTSSLQLRWILLEITSYHVMLYRCRSTNEETKKWRKHITSSLVSSATRLVVSRKLLYIPPYSFPYLLVFVSRYTRNMEGNARGTEKFALPSYKPVKVAWNRAAWRTIATEREIERPC